MCYVLLVWWFAEGSFAALGPVTKKSGTDEETIFFLATLLEKIVYALFGNGGLPSKSENQNPRQVAVLQLPSFWRTDPKLGAKIQMAALLLHSDRTGSSVGL